MQFAGQRTDLQLKPIGEPFNYLIKMTEDILPDPDAVLLTGITPQMTIADGITEVEFLKIFNKEIATPGTTFTGFNSIRFDDEFVRFLHYRNFYDAYEWHWSNDRSRWDLLDVTRMTRALRPEGIKWPFDSNGKPANQLGLLTSINKLDHANAHDALSDVQATIALAQLLQAKQPKLFNYLLEYRDKSKISALVKKKEPFVYTSGKYPSEYEKTTIAISLVDHPKKAASIVFDLRHDPTPYLALSVDELVSAWSHFCKDKPCKHTKLPIKTLQYNRCPAVAPIGVFDEKCQERLGLTLETVRKNLKTLVGAKGFVGKILEALERMDKAQQVRLLSDEQDADSRLYEGFISDKDKTIMKSITAGTPEAIRSANFSFSDDRLNSLLPLYMARNYPKHLSDEDRSVWEVFRARRLLGGKAASRAAHYFSRLSQLTESKDLTGQQKYLLEELQLYGQSILPDEV